jgi:hypothetical protein
MQSKIFTVRFSVEQFERLSNEAIESSMKLGELIRYRLGFESISNTRRIIFLLNKTSNNINQIAKGINIANLTGSVNDSIYNKILLRLAIVQNDFKLFYDLIKSNKNAD